MNSEMAKLAVAESRLREVIRAIVKRRTSPQKSLNWRMMFEIEEEALSVLQQDAELDLRYVNLMASPSAQRLSGTTGTAEMEDDLYPMHTALWMIQEAYYREIR
ncbi:MAG TPA: hypothetical protein VGE12_05925 [Noviherbaspirillum sp.]